MAIKIILSQDSIDHIISLYNNGYSAATIGLIVNRSSGFIQKVLKSNNIQLRSLSDACNRIKTINNTFFDTINTESKAYYLGLLFADGSIKSKSNRIELKLIEQDKDILSKFSNLILGQERLNYIEYKKYPYACKNANNLYTFCVSNKSIKDALIKLGCTPNKSLTLKFPQNIPNELLKHFIRGYFDGDGCITYASLKNHKDFYTAIVSTNDFCVSLQNIILNVLDIKSGIIRGSGKKNTITKKLYIGGNRQVLKFMSWLYSDATYFLQRKYNKFLELKEQCAKIDAKRVINL